MAFSFSSIAAGFIFGILGVFLLKHGKSEAHVPHMILGMGLIMYPLFIANTWLLWGIGIGGLVLAYLVRE
ncbi:MAG: hypothetical protein ACYC3X_14265 [Pirellulaceae bacterium]